ncbi:hypothetical protein E3P99_03576 [Wallemia hederae]|uniref:Mitochondrial carrier n=1 Tax=Wallemia hederae TaxID=1540922 RepID=A0A4V4LSJ6_9BASI|nr:hypothetical protein E3P99_03576 [Wallemia hederae]
MSEFRAFAPSLATPRLTQCSSTLAGGAAGVVASVVTCPLDVIKTKLQAQKKFKGHTLDGVIGIVRRISHEQGFKGFYKGLGPTILGYLPTWAIYFTVYDEVKAVLSSKRGGWNIHAALSLIKLPGDPDGVDWSTHMIASASAGATGATLTNPLWVVKTRFMVVSAVREAEAQDEEEGERRTVDAVAARMLVCIKNDGVGIDVPARGGEDEAADREEVPPRRQQQEDHASGQGYSIRIRIPGIVQRHVGDAAANGPEQRNDAAGVRDYNNRAKQV